MSKGESQVQLLRSRCYQRTRPPNSRSKEPLVPETGLHCTSQQTGMHTGPDSQMLPYAGNSCAVLCTLFSSFTLFSQVDCTLGRKEKVTSLKYLVSRSGHTFRIFTTRLATSSSPAAVFKLNKKCKSVKLPPLLGTGTRPEGQQEKSLSGTQQSRKREYLMGYDVACRG